MTKEKAENFLLDLINEVRIRTSRDKWHRGGKFESIKPLPASDKGEIIECFAIHLAQEAGYNAHRNPAMHGDYDIVIADKHVEVKCATEDVHDNFQFNGISHTKEYDFLLVVGVSPDSVGFNIYTKKEAIKKATVPMAKTARKTAGTTYKFTHTLGQLYSIARFKEVLDARMKGRKPPPLNTILG